MSLSLRTPQAIDRIHMLGRESLLEALDRSPDEYLDVRGDDPASSLREWVETNNPSIVANFGLHAFTELVQSQAQAAHFGAVGTVWMAPTLPNSRFELLIGDRPLLRSGRDSSSSDYLFALPISPRRAFLGSNRREVIDRVLAKGQTALAVALNKETVESADAFVFATNEGQAGLVRKLLRAPPSSPPNAGEQGGKRRAPTPSHS